MSHKSKLNNLPDSSPLLVLNNKGDILYSNAVFKRLFNLVKPSADLIISEPSFKDVYNAFLHSEYSDFRFDATFKTSHNPKAIFNVDLESIELNGDLFYVAKFNSPEEKNKLEQRILDLYNALEFGEIPLLILNETGKVKYSTRSFEMLFDLSIEQIFNKYLSNVMSNIISAEDLADLTKSITKHTRFERIFEIGSDSNLKSIKFNIVPIKDEINSIDNFIVITSDITDVVKQSEKIRSSETKLQGVISNISDLLVIIKVNSDGNAYIENCNDNFCQSFHLIKDKNINKPIQNVLNQQLYKFLSPFLESDIVRETNFAMIKNSNETVVYKVKCSNFINSVSQEKIYTFTFIDITRQQEYENHLKNAYKKEAYLNSLKTSFLENMSHEIRTPYNAIMGYSEIIDDCIANNDYQTVKELTVLVQDVLKRIVNLFTNIVLVSQIEADEIKLDKENVKCSSVLLKAFNQKKREAESKGLEFNLEVEPDLVEVFTDADILERALMPLIDNAVKYTEHGSITLTGHLEDNQYVINIEDSGMGIDQKQISRLLQPFSQEQEGYSRKYEGAGLGLTISHRLFKLLGAQFNISSTKNNGTFITISLPILDKQL